MIIIEAILLMIGAFITLMMINAAFRLGNRIAVATEATALSTAALYYALSPDAKARADAVLEANTKAKEAREAARGERYGKVAAVVCGALLLLLLIAGYARAEGITTQLFDANGNRIGSATEIGKTTTFYDARGNKTGSSTTTGGTTIYYDARGNRTGSTTAPIGRK